MKHTIKTYFKFFIFFFGITIILVNCQRDDDFNLEQGKVTKKAFKTERISSSKIPNIMNLLNLQTNNAFAPDNSKYASGNNVNNNNYGELNLEDIVAVIDTLGNTNYSFKLTNIQDDGLSIYNLIVYTDTDGNTKLPYIMQYKMNEDFATDYFAGNKHFGEFSGSIIRYTIDAFLNNQSSSTNYSSFSADEPSICPCDSTDVVFTPPTGNPTSGGSSGGSIPGSGNPVGGLGEGEPGGSDGGSGGGGQSCIWSASYAPCGCGGTANGHPPSGPPCCEGSPIVITLECFPTNNIVSQTGSNTSTSSIGDDCEVDVNGLCPEDVGYVGVNVGTLDDFIAFETISNCLENLTPSEEGWLQNPNNNSSLHTLSGFIDVNGCSAETIEFAELALEALIENPSLSFNNIVKIANNISKECQANIISESFFLNTTLTNTIMNSLVISTDKHVSVLDITTTEFENAATQPIRATTSDGDFVLIEFNTNYLDQATDLGIVISLLHEMVHAYIVHLYHEGQLLTVYPTYTDLQTAFDAYILIDTSATEEALVKEMHDIYIDFIDLLAGSILQYSTDNNITGIDLAYSKKLAWGSLYGYDVFTDNLTASEQLEAQTIMGYEQQNHPNAKAPKSCN